MSFINMLVSGSGAEQSDLPHVLLVVDQFPRMLGGGERVALRLAAELPKFGYRASILTFSVHPESTEYRASEAPVYLLPLERTYDWNAMRGALALRRFLREQRVEVVQTFFESSDLWAGFVAKAASSSKVIWSRRDMGILRGRKHQIAYKLLAKVPDAVFAVSEQVKRHVTDVDGVDARRVTTIHNGLDLRSWPAHIRPVDRGSRVVISTVGNIRRVKGHDILVRAAGLLHARFPEARFQVGGAVLDEAYARELRALVEELGLDDSFCFTGRVSDTARYLGQSDIFVLPSRSEGFSNAIVEAMAASLPVVATDVGGNAEAVQHDRTGLIVPPDDPEALAEALGRLLGDRALALRMGEAGRRVVEQRFTTAAMLERTTEVYAELLGRR